MRWINGKPEVRVQRDSRNGELDYWVPRERAVELYETGKLHKLVDSDDYSSQPFDGKGVRVGDKII